MRLQFKVIEVGWETDWDDNRHPRIRIGRRDWSAVLYDHPSEGWQVIALERTRWVERHTQIEAYDGADAACQFERLVGGEVDDASLDAIAAELYVTGRQGASKRWVGKTIPLRIHTNKRRSANG